MVGAIPRCTPDCGQWRRAAEAEIVSKPQKPAPKFSPHKWGVTVEVAFARIEAAVGSLGFAEDDLNEGLRSERLKSGEWQISPDNEGTWRPLNSSDWAPRRVRANRLMFPPQPGVFAVPPREGMDIEGPQFAGQVFICRADLDEYYPAAAPPTSTQSDDAGPTTGDWRKPGPKIKRNWRLHVAAEAHRVWKKEGTIPSAADLAAFCGKELGYVPEETDIRKVLRVLLSE
jgi:hypothetical protein